jgi:hypothetical protein
MVIGGFAERSWYTCGLEDDEDRALKRPTSLALSLALSKIDQYASHGEEHTKVSEPYDFLRTVIIIKRQHVCFRGRRTKNDTRKKKYVPFGRVSNVFIVDDEHVNASTLVAGGREARQMSDKTYLIRFKHPALGVRSVTAASAEIHGDHVALLNSKGKLAALFLMEVVESWSESPLLSLPIR